MVTNFERAVMSFLAYGPSGDNSPVLQGWFPDDDLTDDYTNGGFGASVFYKGSMSSPDEVVIAFRGTDFGESDTDAAIDFWYGNIDGADGSYSEQIMQAIFVVADAIAKYGRDKITLTGHSLGGGIASVVAAFFDLPAYVFAPAPFGFTALDIDVDFLPLALPTPGTVAEYFERYREHLNGAPVDLKFDEYRTVFAGVNVVAEAELYAQRAARVDGTYIDGEIVQYLRDGGIPTVGGANLDPIDAGDTTLHPLGAIDLHNILLHAAFVGSDELVLASRQLASLAELMLDTSLYAAQNSSSTPGFLNKLLKEQLASGGPPGSGSLDRFAADLLSLGTLSTLDEAVRDGLIATVIEHYNDALPTETDPFISNFDGRITFDVTQVKERRRPNNGLSRLLEAIRVLALESGPISSGSTQARAGAENAEKWTILTGAGAQQTTGDAADEVQIGSAAASSNQLNGGSGDDVLLAVETGFLHGGDGDDTLIGSTDGDVLEGEDGTDNLFGHEGNDTLRGGSGMDWMYGGTGFDTYRIAAGDGIDVIRDTLGEGVIEFNGANLVVGNRIAENVWEANDGELTIERTLNDAQVPGVYTLTVRNRTGTSNVQVQFWTPGQLSLQLNDTPIQPPTAPPTTTTIAGDFRILDADPQEPGVQPTFDALGNRVNDGTPQDVQDLLFGSTDDDLLIGGALGDILQGGFGDDLIFGGASVSIADAIANGGVGESSAPLVIDGQNGGNFLTGNEGDDILVGTAENEMLAGGEGSDLLIGGQGDDFIAGDFEVVQLPPDFEFNWQVTYSEPNYFFTGNLFSELEAPETSGGDVIYAGGGADHVLAGYGNDVVYGEGGDDRILGQGGADTLYGGTGNDYLNGYTVTGDSTYDPSVDGSDFIDGGDGDDELRGLSGADVLYGGAGDDHLHGDAEEEFGGDDILDGGEDNDELSGDAGADTLIGGSGDDILEGDDAESPIQYQGNDFLDGGDGVDTLYGVGGSDTLLGGANNDTLYGDGAGTADVAQGDDYLDGEAGDDTLIGGGGNDVLFGGANNDQLTGDIGGLAAEFHGADYLDGGDGNDILSGSGGADTLIGGIGNDSLSGDASNTPNEVQLGDYLDGGDGDDTLIGAGGDDMLFGGSGVDQMDGDSSGTAPAIQGNDYLSGGDGNDTMFGGGGSDTLLGGNDNDTLTGDYGSLAAEYHGDDYLDGGAGNDTLSGSGGSDTLIGGSGNDTLTGDASNTPLTVHGADYLDGGEGDDILTGAGGADTLLGGSGNDQMTGDSSVVSTVHGADYMDGGSGSDVLNGGGGNDTVLGGTGDDTLHGDAGDDTLDGGDGVDIVFGDANNDTLRGGAGADQLDGGDGADTLIGGTGDDEMKGELGDDTYRFGRGQGFDQISDWSGANRIVLDASVSPNDVTLLRMARAGSPGGIFLAAPTVDGLALVLSGGTDELLVRNFFTAQSPRPISSIVFANGTVWDSAEIESRVTNLLPTTGSSSHDVIVGTAYDDDLAGLEGDDTLEGGVGDDRLDGGDGNDIVRGSAGDDVLAGSAGDDRLEGGDGEDTYLFTGLFGDDRLVDSESHSRIEFSPGSGITASDLTATRVGNDLRLAVTGGGSLTLEGFYFDMSVADFVFYEGGLPYVYSDIQIASLLDPADSQPYDGLPRPLLVASENQPFSYQVPANYFTDIESQDTLVYSASGLPAWLTFNPTTRTVTGTAPITASGADLSFWVLASDGVNTPTQSFFRLYTRPGLQTLVGDGQDNVFTGGAGAEYVIGGDGSDTIQLGGGLNVIDAGAGNDAITSLAADIIHGGDGDDLIQGSTFAYRTVFGGAGNDVIGFGLVSGDYSGGAGDDYIEGGGTLRGDSGNDALYGSESSDNISGGEGDDHIDGDRGADTLSGDAGDDVILGGWGNDLINAGSGDDIIDGGRQNDDLRGGSGDDRYIGFWHLSDDDVIHESSGFDTLEFNSNVNTLIGSFGVTAQGSGGSSIVIEVVTTFVTITIDATAGIPAIEQFVLYADGLPYRYSAQQIAALATGTNSAPVVNAATANQVLIPNQAFSLVLPANLFTDAESQLSLVHAAALTDGGPLPSWISFSAATLTLSGTPTASDVGIIRVQVTATDAGNLSAAAGVWLDVAASRVFGTAEGETLSGTAAGEVMLAQAGNDVLDAGAGDDVVEGGSGDDSLDGGSGGDYLVGGSGDDVYYFDSAGDVARELADEGNDEVVSEVDLLLPENVERLVLLGSAVKGTGNRLANTLVGNALNNVLLGDAGDDIFDGGAGADTLVGGDGDDSYYVDNASDVVTEFYADQAVGDTVFSTVSWTAEWVIENVTLLGTADINATATGTVANVLQGNVGNNRLDGGGGIDRLIGGLGNDTYIIDVIGDQVVELADEGTDTVQTASTMAAAGLVLGPNIENLTMLGSAAHSATGNELNNTIIGNSGANSLFGDDGNDTLDGGSGNDAMTGGRGNDTYVVAQSGDTVTEVAAQGTDTVNSSITYTLSGEVENLTLTGAGAINGTGNSLDNVLLGNTAGNTLSGQAGNDIIDGGAGNDSMSGGSGDDTFYVDSPSDSVNESNNQGTDTVYSSAATFTLGNNVENLVLLGTGNLNGTGNSAVNVLTGNSGNNTLSGGTGADTMQGGAGDDTYIVDNASDVVAENAGEGNDLVQASLSYTIADIDVENLTLTGNQGFSATGNNSDNVLTGNGGNNTLTGNGGNDTLNGGTGSDTMVGGLGNDVYYVEVAGDVTTESADQGIDTINSSMTRTLVSNIELLFLTGGSAINGTGNNVANIVRGNAAINTLQGGGGTDFLEGGAGADILSNAAGNTLLNGGADNDALTGTANNDMLIGGLGNDAITTGQGADIIMFNQGEGADTVASSTTKDNVLSLGGGILYADLLFQKSGNNLILKAGGTDQITFTNYYASASNRSVDKLQILIEGTSDYDSGSGDALRNKKIATFNFDGLVAAFDAALVANPSLTTWALTNALVAQHLGGSDTAAIGGDLAYRYGRFDTLSDISFTPAVAILAAPGFGTTAQALQSLASLQDSSARLS